MPAAHLYRRCLATLSPVDGWLDWYLLGVLVGLGVADGVIGREARRPLLALAGSRSSRPPRSQSRCSRSSGGRSLVFVGAALVGSFAFRRLSSAARPLAALVAGRIALVPVLGYLLVVAVPLAGARLGRRAEARHAGLRVLAKD